MIVKLRQSSPLPSSTVSWSIHKYLFNYILLYILTPAASASSGPSRKETRVIAYFCIYIDNMQAPPPQPPVLGGSTLVGVRGVAEGRNETREEAPVQERAAVPSRLRRAKNAIKKALKTLIRMSSMLCLPFQSAKGTPLSTRSSRAPSRPWPRGGAATTTTSSSTSHPSFPSPSPSSPLFPFSSP